MKELLLKLKRQGIEIKVINDELRLGNIYVGFEESDLMQEVRNQKTEIINYIKSRRIISTEIQNIPKVPEQEYYRVSPQQRRFFFLHELAPFSLAYNMPQAYLLEGILDVSKIEQVFNLLIERHETLRTSFEMVDKKVVQKIATEHVLKLKNTLASEEEISDILLRFTKPFDLSKAPLLRAELLTLDEERYILLIDMHHIISDGVSQQILIKEFVTAYNGQSMPQLNLQYKDYSEWFYNSYENHARLQKDFWISEFSTLPKSFQLPLDFPRPEVKGTIGSALSFSIDQHIKDKLEGLAIGSRSSLFSILISALGILLSRLSNQEDIIIGTPTAGRTHPDLNKIIGIFVNTLPIRLFPKHHLTFRDYLQHTTLKVLNCFDHQDYSYDQLVDDLKIDRSLSHNPLFDVLFVLQNVEEETIDFKDLKINRYPLSNSSSKFDISLSAASSATGIDFDLEFSTQLFQPETIRRFSQYYQKILIQIAENADLLLEDIDIVSDDEKEFLLGINKDLHVKFPETETLVKLFEQQVVKTPDAIALVFGDEEWTYQRLNRHSNQLARIIQASMSSPNEIVGLLVNKSVYTVIGMLAILKSGGAYLPLDVEHPAERIHFLLQDSKIKILVTESSEVGITGDRCQNIFIDRLSATHDDSNLNRDISSNDLCYIIYTSGTTGNPKGVMVEHRNVVRLLFNEAFQFDFNTQDVWTMFHSHTFDFSVWEMYGALLYGGKLIIIPRQVAQDPKLYLDLMHKHGVTVLNQTPTAFGNLIQEDLKRQASLSALRYVIFGGEALKPFKLKKWKSRYSDVKLINMFGITETTVHVTFKEIGDDEIERNVSNIGKPIPSTSIYLFDRKMKYVPTGVVAELFVGGEGVSRGYLNNEALTSQLFITNPHDPGERLYRTGDLGKILKNGEIEYLGRADRQVQLRGFRIEPGEIEFQLMKHNLIDNVLVVLKTRGESESYLCAYYTSTQEVSATELRTHLQNRVPSHMMPSFFISLDHFPHTANDKINPDQLPDPEIKAQISYVPPETALEQTLASIWSEELSVNQVGLTDNFFHLGGDSLRAIGLIHEINTRFNCNLGVADVYRNQTIAALSEAIKASQTGSTDHHYHTALHEISAFEKDYRQRVGWNEDYEEVFPMNGIEKGMVFYSLKNGAGSVNIHDILYHEQNVYRVSTTNFDFEIFKKAIDLLVKKHGTLRKIFDLENFAHIIKKEITPELYYFDLSALTPLNQETVVLKKIEDEKLKATGLDRSILWRMNILKTNVTSYLLIFDMHHSLFDGWSLQSFISELNNTYIKLLEDSDYRPDDLRCSYRDQIIYELSESKKDDNILFWQNEMVGASRLNFSRKSIENTFSYIPYDLGENLKSALEEKAKKLGTSLKHICFAAYIYSMTLYAEDNDIVVGMITNNRPVVADSEKLLGCYLNSVPMRVCIAENLTWNDYINLIEDKLQRLKKYEKVPFQEIVRLAGEKSYDENPFFDTIFNYTNFRVLKEMLTLEGSEDIYLPYNDKIESESYMNLNTFCGFHVRPEPFLLQISYATAYFDELAVEKLFRKFHEFLQQLLKNGDTRIDELDVLPEHEKKLFAEVNDTTVAYPKEKTIVDLFEEQADKTPDNIALKWGDHSLTYRDLKNKSQCLATYLQHEAGVKTGDLIGVLLDRDGEMLQVIFGILNAGAAYVPLSTQYPPDRINSILSDAKLKVLITRSRYIDALEIPVEMVVIDLDVTMARIAAQIPDQSINRPIGSDLAYIIYTSGSTGKPKGVMIEHHSVVNRILWMQKAYPITPSDVLLQKTPITFDVSVWELFWWSLTGASLYLLTPEAEKDPWEIQKAIDVNKITTIHFVPSMLSAFLSVLDDHTFDLSSLRQVFASGEALKPEVVSEFSKTLNKNYNCRLINLYGPTEATVDVSYYECNFDKDSKIVPIGKPIDNTRLYIISKSGRTCRVGVSGELCIGGVNLARGYINDEVLTAEKFISHPIEPDGRLYRTGDLARWLPDGNIEYLGRSDNQVKIRGFRIELGEIESNIMLYDNVKQTVVAVHGNENDKKLIAFVLPQEKTSLNLFELKKFLKSKLPDYMIPSMVRKVDEIPLTANGKIDTSSLLKLVDKNLVEETVGTKPKTKVEKYLAKIWGDLLNLDDINIEDNFLDLGGHSLLLIRTNKMVQNQYSVELPLNFYFNHTLGQIAMEIANHEKFTGQAH